MLNTTIPLITCILGSLCTYFISKSSTKNEQTSNVLKEQLFEVYLPIVEKLKYTDFDDVNKSQIQKDILSFINNIIKNNFVFVPDILINSFERLSHEDVFNSKSEEFKIFESILHSNYNHLKSVLGYPHKGFLGRCKYLDKMAKIDLLRVLFGVITLLVAIGFLIYVTFDIENPDYIFRVYGKGVDGIAIIVIIIMIFTFLTLLSRYLLKRK